MGSMTASLAPPFESEIAMSLVRRSSIRLFKEAISSARCARLATNADTCPFDAFREGASIRVCIACSIRGMFTVYRSSIDAYSVLYSYISE
mmetsp:Transcript_3427/g.3323  ORF Transcript_3427/g.3323 Transcript_3427/m.3323 type:complete len:91 (+) Transcript_3427:151-423(+)